MFRSLLIPIDLSSSSQRVVERAALLPLAPKGRLTLLHVVPKMLSRAHRRRAEEDAHAALDATAKRVAPALPQSITTQQVVKIGSAAAEIAKQAKSVKAELIVMGRGGGRALRDVVLGSTAERVIRQGQLPVLVVRLPSRALYRRPLLALDLDHAADDALVFMLRLIPSPRPRIMLVHAYDVPYQGLIYPSVSADEAQEYRNHYRQKAFNGIARRLATVLAQAKTTVPEDQGFSWTTDVRHGSPRAVIGRMVKKTSADLLVLGTHGHAGVAHAFLGTVAGDVLREVRCDVLVVPPRGHPTKRT